MKTKDFQTRRTDSFVPIFWGHSTVVEVLFVEPPYGPFRGAEFRLGFFAVSHLKSPSVSKPSPIESSCITPNFGISGRV